MVTKNRVLLVGKKHECLTRAAEALSAAGYDTAIFHKGRDVNKLLERELPDLILLVPNLPDMKGMELCQRVRLYVDRFLPVIVMLEHSTPDSRVTAYDSGADDCIELNFDSRELVARVRAMLRLKNAIDNLYKSREELDEARARLERLVVLDGLTDLFNHRHMHEILDDEIQRAKRYNIPLSIIMCDIDKFSSVNDLHGHQAGDRVLREVAALISRNCRSTDRVCRYGGDEVLVICPHTEISQALQVAHRLRKAVLSATFYSERNPIKLTGSFGVSSLATAGSKRALIEQADEAHYTAKALGGNRVCEWVRGLAALSGLKPPGHSPKPEARQPR